MQIDIRMANATTIDLPLLDDAEIKWQSEGNANVYVNKQEQMEVAIGPNSTSGAFRELPFEANTTENDLTFVLDRFYVYIMVPNTTDYVALFKPDVLAYNDYYPFGSLVPNRHGSNTAYRYGFQGQEKDDKL